VLFIGGVLFVVFQPRLRPLRLLGLAVGAPSTVVPVNLAKLSPYEIRGSITEHNELAIESGQLATFVARTGNRTMPDGRRPPHANRR
jgi:MFS transporter, SP family, major inositol transporter